VVLVLAVVIDAVLQYMQQTCIMLGLDKWVILTEISSTVCNAKMCIARMTKLISLHCMCAVS